MLKAENRREKNIKKSSYLSIPSSLFFLKILFLGLLTTVGELFVEDGLGGWEGGTVSGGGRGFCRGWNEKG